MKKTGVTLLEVVLGVIIVGILFTTAFELFRSGLGSATVANQRLESFRLAANLMGQIASDFERGLEIASLPPSGTGRDGFSLRCAAGWKKGELVTGVVTFQEENNGVSRTEGSQGGPLHHLYCSGHLTDLRVTRLSLGGGREGLRIHLRLTPLPPGAQGGTGESSPRSGAVEMTRFFSLPLSRPVRDSWNLEKRGFAAPR